MGTGAATGCTQRQTMPARLGTTARNRAARVGNERTERSAGDRMIARDIAVAGAFRSLMSAPASDLRAAARTRRQSYERPGPPLPVPGLFLASDIVRRGRETHRWQEHRPSGNGKWSPRRRAASTWPKHTTRSRRPLPTDNGGGSFAGSPSSSFSRRSEHRRGTYSGRPARSTTCWP